MAQNPSSGLGNLAISSSQPSQTKAVQSKGRAETSRRGRGNRSETLSFSKLFAAVTNLSDKLDTEITNMANKFAEDLAGFSSKIEGDFTSLSNKLDVDFANISSELNIEMCQKLDILDNTITNRIDQVAADINNLPTMITPAHPAPAPGVVATPTPTQPWNYSTELRERVYRYAYESVAEAGIAAYTAISTPNGAILVNSLVNTIKVKINSVEAPWPAQQLPPVVNGAQNVSATQRYNTLVRDAGKHARERMHHLVLYNIRGQPEGTVPNMKTLVHRIEMSCGTLDVVPDVNTYWAQTELPKRLRVAYLRREALRIFQSLRSGGAGGNIWRRVDRQLHHLGQQGSLYTSAFYKLIYKADIDLFDGQGYFEDIDPEETFDLPSEEMIEAEMDEIEQAGGALGLQD
ncbi:hypothetical protein DFH28DRAFT_1087960 [Melampsora americana]|nr:hypothetical protein DFH28DRAFT_1087960 [Melampsora americana]